MSYLPTDLRPVDALCLGRAGVDLYAREHNTPMGEVSGFEKYVGGSPANIAVAMSRLGAKVGMIGMVSADSLGEYVRDYLRSEGVSVEGLGTVADGSRTSLAVTEMRPDNCEVVIYRNRAADLALAPEHIDPQMIASARLLVISGTALCESPSREAVFAALLAAEQAGTSVMLDLDYRAYNWRSLADASACYRLAARFATLVVGNREEFEVLGAPVQDGDAAIAASLLDAPGATRVVFVKAGAEGSKVYTDKQPAPIEQAVFTVQATKPFGAGDAYAGTICAGLLAGLPLAECVRRGSAAAAIVVAGNSCSDASPTETELSTFMTQHR
ncbi:MAG: 5-dehydro-2-deoxygluconokinase [Granulosicoccaceae bacterium]